MVTDVVSERFGFLASLGFQSWPVEDVVRCLADLGYDAVEWTLGHFDPTASSGDLADLVRVPSRHGLVASEIVVQQDFVTPDPALFEARVSLVEACIPAAAGIGISVLNLCTGPAPWDPKAPRLGKDISEGEAWALVGKAFDRLVPLAERHHVYLAVEAVFGHLCHDYYTLLELLRRYDSEFLAVNMDPSHYRLYGNDIDWVVHQLGARIQHVHLKDVVGRPGMVGEDFTFPLLGEGVVDWGAFRQALGDVDYRGVMSVEFEAFGYYAQILGRDPAKAAELSMQQIRALFPSQ